jgi:hypothetical protein
VQQGCGSSDIFVWRRSSYLDFLVWPPLRLRDPFKIDEGFVTPRRTYKTASLSIWAAPFFFAYFAVAWSPVRATRR